MTVLKPTTCCGVWDLNNLSLSHAPHDALLAIYPFLRPGIDRSYYKPFIVFTGVVHRVKIDHASGRMDDYGQAFADFITIRGLGSIVRSGNGINHGAGGNTLAVWIWQVNYSALWEYYKNNPIKVDNPTYKVTA